MIKITEGALHENCVKLREVLMPYMVDGVDYVFEYYCSGNGGQGASCNI